MPGGRDVPPTKNASDQVCTTPRRWLHARHVHARTMQPFFFFESLCDQAVAMYDQEGLSDQDLLNFKLPDQGVPAAGIARRAQTHAPHTIQLHPRNPLHHQHKSRRRRQTRRCHQLKAWWSEVDSRTPSPCLLAHAFTRHYPFHTPTTPSRHMPLHPRGPLYHRSRNRTGSTEGRDAVGTGADQTHSAHSGRRRCLLPGTRRRRGRRGRR